MKQTKQFAVNSLKALILPAVVYLFFFAVSRILKTSSFGTSPHMFAIMQMTIQPAILAWGLSFNMYSKRWDFSAGAIMLLAAIIGADLAVRGGFGAIGLLICCVGVASVLGCISGIVYLFMQVPSIVTSLGMLMVYESVTTLFKDGSGTSIRGDITMFGQAPYNFILLGIMFCITYIIFSYTKVGYHIRALGGAQMIAVNTGINTRKMAIISYLLLGCYAGVAATISISTAGAARAVTNMGSTGTMFDAMMCIMIGMALSKYCNGVVATFIGCFSMKMLSAGLLSLGLSATLQNVATGMFLFIFIAITTNQGAFTRRKQLAERARVANVKFKAVT